MNKKYTKSNTPPHTHTYYQTGWFYWLYQHLNDFKLAEYRNQIKVMIESKQTVWIRLQCIHAKKGVLK